MKKKYQTICLLTAFSGLAVFSGSQLIGQSTSTQDGSAQQSSVLEPATAEPVIIEAPDYPIEDKECVAQFIDGYWNVKTDCREDCLCITPPTTSLGPQPDEGDTEPFTAKFGCDNTLVTATAERFFLNLIGKGTGQHKLAFDKTGTPMFEAFRIRVLGPDSKVDQVVWQIDAVVTGTNTSTLSLDNDLNCNATDSGCAVLTVDSQEFGNQSFTGTFEPDTPQTLNFGIWELTIEYLPNL